MTFQRLPFMQRHETDGGMGRTDGGMGIPILRYLIPLNANNRLAYTLLCTHPNLLKIDNKIISNTNQINNHFKKLLYKTCDWAGLRQSTRCPSSHNWRSNGSRLLLGKDYIHCIQFRYGCLYNWSSCAKGRDEKDKTCKRECRMLETLNHILQVCYATHHRKIKRHDAIVDYNRKICEARRRTVHKEYHFTEGNKTLKPDIVIYNEERVVVVNVQVVNDQMSLEDAHRTKVGKYEVLNNQLRGLWPGDSNAAS